MPQAIAAAAVWVGNAVGTAIGGLLTAGGVAATTALPLAVAAANAAYLVAEIALYTGLQNIVDDISNEKAAPQGHELSLRIASDVAREMVIGVRPLAGSMVARYSYGKDVTQASFVYQLADHPCVELTKVYGDGRLVQSSPLAHGVRTEITAYSYSGGPRVWMTWHDGRPGQTADAQLVLKSPTDPDVVAGAYGAWTSAHVGAGNSYVHVEVHHDDDILTSIPEFLFLIKGARLYDRRKDTTAGGSGSHRLATPSTWEYSTNNAVACDHYLLGYKVENDPLAFGIGLSPVEVPYATFARAADLCDEDVTTGTGGDTFVMKRYECNAIISTAEAFESVLNNFQNQMAARIVDLGGRIGIIGAEEQTATISLSDLDWATDESVRFADKLTFDGLYGAVLGSYPDPANMWQPTPYTRQATEYLALQDGGEAATAQLDLPYETNSRRAIRLAAAWIARESLQPRMVGTFATRSRAWKLEPGDWFNMSSDRWQFSNQKFEVVDIVKHDDFTVTLTGRAIDPNFLAFSTDDDPDLGVPPVLDPYQLLMDAPTFSASASTLVAGGVVEPCIEVTLTSSEALAREIVVEVGKWNGSTIDTPTMVDAYHAGQIVTKIRKGILPSTAYKVRMKKRAGVRESPWTAWSSVVTTGATYSVGSAGIADTIVGQGALATLNTINSSGLIGAGVVTPSKMTGDGADLLPDDFGDLAAWQQSGGVWTFSTADNTQRLAMDAARVAKGPAGNGTTTQAATELLQISALRPAIEPGRSYRFFMRSLAPAGFTGRMRMRIIWIAYDGTQAGSTTNVIGTDYRTTPAAAQTVQDFSTLVVAPAGAATLTVRPYVEYSTTQNNAGTPYFSHPRCFPSAQLGSNVVLQNGTTIATDAALVTSSGTAAGIAGQAPAATDSTIQAGATKNTLTFASSAPSSPTNGDIWVDTTTTPYLIKTRVSGAWQISASYGGVFGGTLYETGGGAVATLANFKTISGTSAGFTGQGALATLNLVAQAQLAAGVGANACVDTGFRFASQYWAHRYNDTGLTPVYSFGAEGGLQRAYVSVTGTPAATKVFNLAQSGGGSVGAMAHLLPVAGGDRVEASIYLGFGGGVTAAKVNVLEFDASGNLIVATAGPAAASAAGGGSLSTYARSAVFVTTNASTRFVAIEVQLTCSGSANPWYKAAAPLLRRATTGQTEFTPFAPGIEAQLGADVTSGGISAGIAGQGSQAIANAQRGSSYSGTPTEGSWWSDTSVNKLKYYTGGTWYPVAVLTVEPQSALYGPTTLTSATYVNMASITMPAEMPSGAKLRFTPGVTEASSASGTTTVSWRIQDTTGGTTVASGTFACNVAGVVSANTSLTSMISQLFTAAGAGPRTYEFQMQKGSQNLTSIDGIFIGERVG